MVFEKWAVDFDEAAVPVLGIKVGLRERIEQANYRLRKRRIVKETGLKFLGSCIMHGQSVTKFS